MNSVTGIIPPLHRRFSERKAKQYIRNRYRNLRPKIEKQVEVLQNDKPFREKCKEYYKIGYKDWIIISAIFNCMLNWKCKELGIEYPNKDYMDKSRQQIDLLREVVYPPERFLDRDIEMRESPIDFNIKMHFPTVLITYGFEPRRRDFKPEIVEKFLIERMRHLDFDLPHKPLFGEPPGDWPII